MDEISKLSVVLRVLPIACIHFVQDNFCPSYGPFAYEVNLTAQYSVTVNHLSCGKIFCVISFNNLTGETEEFAVSVKAINELGSSDIVHDPIIIGK